MIFDTDIFIWVQRGNDKTAALMEKSKSRRLSIQTYMELLQVAKSKTQHNYEEILSHRMVLLFYHSLKILVTGLQFTLKSTHFLRL